MLIIAFRANNFGVSNQKWSHFQGDNRTSDVEQSGCFYSISVLNPEGIARGSRPVHSQCRRPKLCAPFLWRQQRARRLLWKCVKKGVAACNRISRGLGGGIDALALVFLHFEPPLDA